MSPTLVYGHSSLSLYGLYTLFDLPLQYTYLLLALRRFVLDLRACAHPREIVTDVTVARTCESVAQLRKSRIPGSEPSGVHSVDSFWKFSPLSYGGMRFRGFCSPSAFENRGSSPDCGSETSFLFPFIVLNEERTTELSFQANWGANKRHDATGSGACRLF
jgi:hypothetical protein